jgi:hypothetical protein
MVGLLPGVRGGGFDHYTCANEGFCFIKRFSRAARATAWRYPARAMTSVYRKTDKGVAEITTRAHRLVPRLRSALILVDGRKTDDELAELILVEPAAALASLLADGFIEVLATLAERPPERKVVTPGPSVDFETLRRDAVRQLTNQVGPAADTVAIMIERAKTMAELEPLLVRGAQILHNMRGTAAAQAFAARFISSPEP